MNICTIIAKNYVAQARVLACSFAQHHPEGSCWVLVIDDYDRYLDPSAEPFRILTPQEIGCDEFDEMALRYDVLELSTAVKPWLLAHLLGEGMPAITYLDPDIRIHSSLEPLDALARTHGVVLTPHNTEPLPDDGNRPNQIDILLAGVYNLGYVSLGASEETSTLLRWWRERLLTDCRVDPLNGYFVDQRWFDLAPGLMPDNAILREPQYNVAYWNLHSRNLHHDGHGYTVNGEPLGFFHYSGFDPQVPHLLSRHQSRIKVRPGTALERICREYSEEVAAAGYHEAKEWPYTFHQLPSGVEFNRRLRKLFEIAQERDEVEGSPFTHDGDASFMNWLAAPAPGAPSGVNRLLAEMYGTRIDLQEAFPDVAGDDHGRFLDWAREVGVVEEPALAVLSSLDSTLAMNGAPKPTGSGGLPESSALLTGNPPADPVASSSPVAWGVNVVGYFRSELGTGEAARQVVSALDARGVPLLPVHGRTIPPNRQGHAYTQLDYTKARYLINLICMNADVLGEFAAQAGPEFFASRYSIGMWFWEVEQFPEIWLSAFDHVDELWLPTEHVIRAISPVSSVPIMKITLPVEMPPMLPATRAELGLPNGFMFLFSFDYHSVFERKNPLAVIEAYTRSFDPEDGAVLVIKSINAESAPSEHGRLLAAAAERPDVHVTDGYVTAEQKNMMVASCDCYVSLHRAEGFGLTMAEAMYLGKPVVATAYSGNLDFMTDQNSFLVEYDLVEIGHEASPYPPEAQWAEPDVQHAGQLMRKIFEQREQAELIGRRGAEDIRRTHSPAAAGEIMGRRLDLLRERHAEQLKVSPLVSSRANSLAQRVYDGPPAGPPSRLGRIRKLGRRAVLRFMKPFTAHQRSLDAEIIGLLGTLELRLGELEIAGTEQHARLLAELRSDASRREIWRHISGLARSTIALESATGDMQVALGELPEVPQRLKELAVSLQRLELENRAIPYMEGAPLSEISHPQVGLVQGYQDDSEASDTDMYRSFEDTFRGSESFIRDRQRVFIPLVEGHSPVLDLGCGRGEFLDLLAEHGIAYNGVDSDVGMVRRCHHKGHSQVVHEDGLEYLSALEDCALGAIFCAQVIEHLPYDALLRLFRLAREKLRPEGIFIAETVNPHSTSALKTFWVDPTHQHPIFPEVALVLARSSGFPAAFIFHPNGTSNVEDDRFAQGEYALVAGDESLLTPEPVGRERADSNKGKRSVSSPECR